MHRVCSGCMVRFCHRGSLAVYSRGDECCARGLREDCWVSIVGLGRTALECIFSGRVAGKPAMDRHESAHLWECAAPRGLWNSRSVLGRLMAAVVV